MPFHPENSIKHLLTTVTGSGMILALFIHQGISNPVQGAYDETHRNI
jgi:hypothetical protein